METTWYKMAKIGWTYSEGTFISPNGKDRIVGKEELERRGSSTMFEGMSFIILGVDPRSSALLSATIRLYKGRCVMTMDTPNLMVITAPPMHKSAPYYEAVARGLPVIHMSWLDACIAVGEAVDTTPYIMPWSGFAPELVMPMGDKMEHVLQSRWELEVADRRTVLKDLKFTNVQAAPVQALIVEMGGEMVDIGDMYGIIIITPCAPTPPVNEGRCIRSSEWLIQCALHGHIADHANYDPWNYIYQPPTSIWDMDTIRPISMAMDGSVYMFTSMGRYFTIGDYVGIDGHYDQKYIARLDGMIHKDGNWFATVRRFTRTRVMAAVLEWDPTSPAEEVDAYAIATRLLVVQVDDPEEAALEHYGCCANHIDWKERVYLVQKDI